MTDILTLDQEIARMQAEIDTLRAGCAQDEADLAAADEALALEQAVVDEAGAAVSRALAALQPPRPGVTDRRRPGDAEALQQAYDQAHRVWEEACTPLQAALVARTTAAQRRGNRNAAIRQRENAIEAAAYRRGRLAEQAARAAAANSGMLQRLRDKVLAARGSA